MIEILIADDHKIFRKGLKQTINDNTGMAVRDEAANGREVLDQLAKRLYDVVMLDISMPGLNGLETLKQIKADYPDIPVIILSMHPEEQYALRVMKAGAAGYLTKETDEKHIIEAILKAHKGGKYITPTLAEKLAYALAIDSDKPVHETLSDREYQVMCMIAEGKTVSSISASLNISMSTVSTYRGRILEKTGLQNSAEITHYMIRNKLI